MANNEQELQKAFMAFLIEDAAAQGVKIQSEEDLKAYAQQLGKEGLQAKYQEFMQRMQGGVKAKLGAKLDYIRKIKGLCAEDEELVYMKKGGRMCPACEKKKKAMKAEEGEKLDPVKKFKCGRKVKKAEPGAKFTQKTKTDKYGNTTHTRTYPGHKPVSYTVSEDGEGEGYYSDHKGRSRVEDQDSLGRVYHNGPLKLKKINKHQYGGPLSDEQSLYLTDKEAYEQYLKSQNDYYSQLADENEVTWNPITWGKELYYRYKSVPMLGGRSENENPFILTGTAPGPGMKAKNALEALQIVKSMKAAKATKAAKAVKTLPTSINESGLTKSGKDNINRIINALPEAERQPIINALLQNEKFWNTYGDGFFNVSPNRAASTINAIRRKLGFSGQGNNYAGTVKYGRQMSGFKERMTEDATSLTTGTKRTTTLKPDK